jgi:(E)-4-hydroxy-3-methylbut-2-enyl-diphosphate synthase
MKSSNPQVMVQAYRLLVKTMVSEGMNYPLHLGVTEAGDGEDGRIKSAVGIGTLLADGLGDTVRVSLTEDPEFEAPVARALVRRFENKPLAAAFEDELPGLSFSELTRDYSPFKYKRRRTSEQGNYGQRNVPRVIINLANANLKDPHILAGVGYTYSSLLDKYHIGDQACDMVYLANQLPSFSFPGGLKQLYDFATWKNLIDQKNCHPLFSLNEFNQNAERDEELNFVRVFAEDLEVSALRNLDKTVLVLCTEAENAMQMLRFAFIQLLNADINVPVVLERNLGNISLSDLQLAAATDFGGLFVDGFGDGVWLAADTLTSNELNSVSFGVLQATRTRISKTEYISCPSCGRTLFDLQETTQAIRTRTSHLKGVKIGIMGCIVNGPGEMADADYGYVGAGPGKITLYRGQEVMKKNMDASQAIDELINIIKADGRWVEKE